MHLAIVLFFEAHLDNLLTQFCSLFLSFFLHNYNHLLGGLTLHFTDVNVGFGRGAVPMFLDTFVNRIFLDYSETLKDLRLSLVTHLGARAIGDCIEVGEFR